jgi:isocitrate dehydrogenase kinase/phosphatase
MSKKLTDSRLANLAAGSIYQAFKSYRYEFNEITQRAKIRFKAMDWSGMRSDASERLDLYKAVVGRIEDEIRRLLHSRISDKLVWASMKAVYSGLISGRNDWELAETFFNSVTRRIFATVGVDPQIEFVDSDFITPPTRASEAIFRTYEGRASIADIIRGILTDYPLTAGFEDLRRDAEFVAKEIERRLGDIGSPGKIERIQMADRIFYRGMGAYAIGRMHIGKTLVPLVISLLNSRQGVKVDHVLLDEDETSILFSFARSYFHVEVERPYDLVRFLKKILPRKRVSELYISIGFNKHGKTELYRELLNHLTACAEDRFEISPGERGMVMIVFNMPNDDLVFKLIRDRFGTPKRVTRRTVMAKYDFVFRHDRVGRLVDAQAFEHLKFDQCCFSPDLLEEFQRHAGQAVRIKDDHVIVDHVYVERRVTPLDIFVQEADQEAARSVIIDFGNAIKDLAASNLFPGDFLLKNFGVTRHGRVVFYDYDELCPLTSCNFNNLPDASRYEDEMASEPWYYVDENDVFPEEFRKFLQLSGALREVFLEHHADLFEVEFWRRAQENIEAGVQPYFFPDVRRL